MNRQDVSVAKRKKQADPLASLQIGSGIPGHPVYKGENRTCSILLVMSMLQPAFPLAAQAQPLEQTHPADRYDAFRGDNCGSRVGAGGRRAATRGHHFVVVRTAGAITRLGHGHGNRGAAPGQRAG